MTPVDDKARLRIMLLKARATKQALPMPIMPPHRTIKKLKGILEIQIKEVSLEFPDYLIVYALDSELEREFFLCKKSEF